jgi:hypothetical protein
MTKLRVIALCGPKYSGKDTAAQAFLDKPGFVRAPMAEGVKNIVTETFGWGPELYEDPVLKEKKLPVWPFIEPRWPLMDIANWMRDKYGGDVWAHRWERKWTAYNNFEAELEPVKPTYVVTDVRFPDDEMPMFRRHNTLLIYIHRDQAEESLAKAQAANNAMALNQSEAHYPRLRALANAVVENNGTVGALHAQVQAVVRNAWGHWKYWNQERSVA